MSYLLAGSDSDSVHIIYYKPSMAISCWNCYYQLLSLGFGLQLCCTISSYYCGWVWFWRCSLKLWSAGNNRVMKLRWFGRCFFTYISSTLQIGTTVVQCPPSSSSMVRPLLLFIHLSILALALGYIMWSSVCFAYPECTSTTYTQTMLLPSGLQSSTLPHFFSEVCVGLAIAFSAKRSLSGLLIRRVMLCGTCSWVSIPTLQTRSWCFAGLSSGDGHLR